MMDETVHGHNSAVYILSNARRVVLISDGMSRAGGQCAHSAAAMQDTAKPEHFASKIIFDQLAALLEAEGEALVAKVKGVYLFRVRQGRDGAEATWIVDAKNGSGSVEFNGTG